MRPVRIQIEGLRSFRAEEEIDFGDRTQIAVIGDTGAGKSSILEAMTYALYGQTSLGGRSKQELMNDTSDAMRVVLRFRVGGEEWEVTRVDRRSGAGGLGPARAQLVRFGPGGETIEKVEQVKPVNNRVQALIGLDSGAFLRTVILPQGRFARLLVEDAPSARTEILRQVWRTQDLEAAGEVAGRRLAEVKTLGMRLQDEVRRHPDDPEAHLASLSSQAAEADRRASALADLRDRSVRAAHALVRSGERIAATRQAGERVTPSAIDELADRLVPVERAQRRMEAEATELEEREASLKRELDAIPTDDGPDPKQIARALAGLEAIPDEVERAVDRAQALRCAIADESEAEKRHAQAQQALEAATERVSRHQASAPPLAEAVASAAELLRKAEHSYEKCKDLQGRIRSTGAGLAEREQEMAGITRRLATAERALQAARERLERAERELGEAQRTNAAAAAAHGLCPGDECPICHQGLAEGWTPPPGTGLDRARAAHEAVESEAREARRAVAGCEAQQESGQRWMEDTRNDLDELRSEISGALDHLRAAAGADDAFPLAEDAPLPDRDQVLAPVSQRVEKADQELRQHQTEADALGKAQTSAQVEEASTRQALDHARRDIDRNRDAAGEALGALRRNIQSIPTSFRPHLILPSDPVELETVDTTPADRASYAAREREEILQLREQKRGRLRAEIEDTSTALRRLVETRATEVDAPLQAFMRMLAEHRAALADAVRHLDADVAIPAALHYPVDTVTLREGIGRLRETMVGVLALARDVRRRAVAAANQARSEVQEIALQVDPPADPADLDALVRSTGEAAAEAGFTARATTQARDEFAEILADLLTLRQTAKEVAGLELALGDLDAALKPGAFLKWLTLRRSRDLLVYASRMLEEMTAGRYSFADPGNLEDQQWLVVDNDSGQARSPASLSGGEQFIGSLALALGMVEMMARSGGRLESLFLDEGFGSLDRSNLDSAIEALSMVAGTGRMVGVISHVGAVAEQIDDVLAVTRNAKGSRAIWLSRAERQRVASSDAEIEGASALTGLLE